MEDSDTQIALSQADQDEIKDALKQTLGNTVHNVSTGVASALYAVAAAEAGVLPFTSGPTPLELAGLGALFSVIWAVSYFNSVRPAKNRLEEKLEELDDRA